MAARDVSAFGLTDVASGVSTTGATTGAFSAVWGAVMGVGAVTGGVVAGAGVVTVASGALFRLFVAFFASVASPTRARAIGARVRPDR